ncbi:MAG: TlpA family protein disulfide reductase [Inhella sp.]
MTIRRRPLALLGLAAAGVGGLLWQLQALPETPAIDYVLLDGKAASSAQWRGRVMLVNFWATSCTSCVKKMPMLISTHLRYKEQGFDTLAVAMQYDPPAFVAQFAASRQLPFGVAIDNQGHIAHAFGGVTATPTTLLIDRQGRIHQRLLGEIEEARLHQLIEGLLAG